MKTSSHSAMRKAAGGGPFPQLSWFEYSEIFDGTPRYTYQFGDYLIIIGPDMHGVCGDGGWDWEVSRANMKSDLLEQSWNKCDSLEDAYEDLRRVVFHEDPEHRCSLWFDDMKGMDILFGGRRRAAHEEVLATIESVNPRDARTLYISTNFDSASLYICMSGCDRRLVYWDSRFDIFLWACDMAGFDKNTSIWVDEAEGVLYTYSDLCEEAHNANRHTRSGKRTKRAYMDRDDILDAIYDLSRSQGFYGRLLADLEDLMEYDPDRYEDVMFELEEQRFNDPVDMVMYFEC